MGQGTLTTLPAIIADELDADWAKVRTVLPPAWEEKKWGNPGYNGSFQTSASNSVQGYFKPLRIAGAQARRVLLDAVAARWNVPVGELSTEPSVVVHKASGRRMTYGEVAAFAKAPAELPKIDDKDLKSPASFRYIGKDVPRVDVPSKVTGAAKYAIDVQVPGMLYAAVLQSPYPGGAPQSVERRRRCASCRASPTSCACRTASASSAPRVEATQAAKRQLKVTWSKAPGADHDSERRAGAFRRGRARPEPRRRALRTEGRRQGRHEGRGARVPRRLPHALRLSRPDGAAERDRLGQP